MVRHFGKDEASQYFVEMQMEGCSVYAAEASGLIPNHRNHDAAPIFALTDYRGGFRSVGRRHEG